MNSTHIETLKHAIKHFSKNQKKPSKKTINFPSTNKIRSNHDQYFSVIAEQAQKLINDTTTDRLCGIEHWQEDRERLIERFTSDLIQFLTTENISITGINTLTYGQNIIPDKAAFNIARSQLLPNTYKSINLNNHKSEYQIYSIPFLIRLAIENKLKSIIGFTKSDTKHKNRTQKNTQEFPVSPLITELKKLDCLNIPCSLDDLQNIYKWSCNFCHTGKKEYIWLSLKAIELVSPLFEHEEQLKRQINIQQLWGHCVLSPEFTIEKLMNHKGPTHPLYYLKTGWSIKKLERELNTTKTNSLMPYIFYLSETALDESSPFYCSRHKTHI